MGVEGEGGGVVMGGGTKKIRKNDTKIEKSKLNRPKPTPGAPGGSYETNGLRKVISAKS